MPEFDRYEHSYREEVERAIGFVRQDLDFFAKAKARELLGLVERRVGNPSELIALDVGCGTGETDHDLGSRFSGFHGVDVSARMIEVASAANPTFQYQVYDGRTLPFENETFDVVFAICVLHHVPPTNWPRFVGEMRRVTRKNGLVAVIEHNPFNPLTRLTVSRCAFDEDATLLRRKTVERLFDQNGLDRCDARYIMFFPWDGSVLRSIEVCLRRVPLGAQYVIAGRPRPSTTTQ